MLFFTLSENASFLARYIDGYMIHLVNLSAEENMKVVSLIIKSEFQRNNLMPAKFV